MQGRAAQIAGNVTPSPPGDDALLRAQVKDDGKTHGVTIAADGRHAVAECSCDAYAQGQFCTHIWAALLNRQHSDDAPDAGATLEELGRLRLRAPKARKRQGPARDEHRRSEPRWMSRLTLLQPGADAGRDTTMHALAAAQRQVCYVVLPRPSERSRGLVVELHQRSAIASGWSKPKPLKFSADALGTLGDPIDRELVSMLLGAGRVGDEENLRLPRSLTQHATYRLSLGAQRSLLRRMIDTGRCFVDTSDEDANEISLRPLTWEVQAKTDDSADPDPRTRDASSSWVPWLVGHPAPGALRLELQLRREGRRVPATKPLLVLGGPDGMVIFAESIRPKRGRRRAAAVAGKLDDRDALPWIQQFRDTRFEDDALTDGMELDTPIEPGTMLVPDDQVAGFLERLYLLPQLPELDLPDGLGYAEQRVEPRPTLELFSPGTAQATDLGSTQKTLLAGRISFDYAGVRVSPTQAGRFVPVAASADATDSAPALTEKKNSGDADNTEHTDNNNPPTNPDDDGDVEAAVLTAVEEVEGFDGEDARRLIRRNFRAEREAIEQTAGLGLCRASTASPDALLLPSKHVPAAVSKLLAQGWSIFADQKLLRAPGPPALSISSGIDWFELRGDVNFTDASGNEQSIPLPTILEAARAGRLMVELDDGSQGLLPEQWLSEHGLLTALGELHGDHLRFRQSQAAVLDALLDEQELLRVDDPFDEARRAIRGFDGIDALSPHADFQGTLRTYQKHGLGWFEFLRRFGMGGILADDMGLGKTVQVLAMLQQRRKDAGKDAQPTLIVAPRSVVFNWIDEAEKFTPDLKVLAYAGPDRVQYLKDLGKYDLIVTSYGLMRRDAEKLAETRFDYIVLDEAQSIKNPGSQSAKAARLLNTEHRLALTGTPVENHLGDLWSIFEFLNPGMLGANARFADLVRGATANIDADQLGPDAPLDEEQDDEISSEALEDLAHAGDDETAALAALETSKPKTGSQRSPLFQLATALRPFILRRTKAQVLSDLPAKTEQTIHCEMEPAQRKVYDELRNYYRGTLINQLDANGVTTGSKSLGRSAFMVLEALLRLRQAACHPALINKAGIDTADAPSAKLDTLTEMLSEVVDEGQKALVFSQFTSMLALVRQRFDALGIKYAYLDGQTRNRKQVVEDFQSDPDVKVFLISLKAGGVGLNLTAAEYVFILDPWWNPAVEQQAIDRTHRIGQTKPVFAYRMICEDTVEQRILELQKRKRNLADAIVGGEQNVLSSLTRNDLEALLA